jgi:hypothetical protein
MLRIRANNVTFRSRSGNRDAVIIRGEGMYGNITHIFDVSGTNFTVADLTIGWVKAHAIQIHGEHNADSPLIHNVRFVDTYQPMLNVSTDGGRYSSDHGIVEWCLFEYSPELGPRDYIGGVDAHQACNWVVRNNVFRNITNQNSRLAEYAIRFSSESSNTVVESNVITNCDRGIGFGLERHEHLGGMIRNNMVHTTRDVSINLVHSRDTMVYNNTVYVN